MTYYFASDLHLQRSATESSERFARFVDQLSPDDHLFLCGDLCDFWFSTQEQHTTSPEQIEGLSALLRFHDRGGEVRAILGNHDLHLKDYYQQQLKLRIEPEPVELNCYEYHLTIRHGHLTGPVSKGKALLATRLFHDAFSFLPRSFARAFHHARIQGNAQTQDARNAKFLKAYREFIKSDEHRNRTGQIYLFGHVHQVTSEMHGSARMIVFDDWTRGENFLRIDASGIQFFSPETPDGKSI